MKILKIAALFVISALILSSCSGKMSADDLAREVKKSYTESDHISMNAEITANYAARAWRFLVKYEGGSGGGTVTILEPENVSGISARIDADGVTLVYDGAEVFTGEVTEDGLSPVDALPVIVSLWRGGIVTGAAWETADGEKCLAVSYRITDGVTARTLFDTETLLPVSAELIRGGYAVLSLRFLNVTF